MVRKQLYIDEQQERQLKTRSRELGISEAEIVRRLLERGLSEGSEARLPRTDVVSHIELFLDVARRTEAATKLVPYDRDQLYSDRGNRSRRRT